MNTSQRTTYVDPNVVDTRPPYRRVWRSFVIENAIILIVVVAATLLGGLVSIPRELWLSVSVALALMPFIAWLIFSYGGELLAPIRRRHLFSVLAISVLVGNALGYPLIERWLNVDEWASQLTLSSRIVVYALALGVIPEVLKYMVIRYSVWFTHLHTRSDIFAYSIAATVGYVSVHNLHYAISNVPPPDVAAGRIFAMTTLAMVSSLVTSYGIAVARFENPSLLILPGFLSGASLLVGAIYSVRSAIANTRFTSAISAPRMWYGLVISVFALAAVSLAVLVLLRGAVDIAESASELNS